jgi:hypothetical protein
MRQHIAAKFAAHAATGAMSKLLECKQINVSETLSGNQGLGPPALKRSAHLKFF